MSEVFEIVDIEDMNLGQVRSGKMNRTFMHSNKKNQELQASCVCVCVCVCVPLTGSNPLLPLAGR